MSRRIKNRKPDSIENDMSYQKAVANLDKYKYITNFLKELIKEEFDNQELQFTEQAGEDDISVSCMLNKCVWLEATCLLKPKLFSFKLEYSNSSNFEAYQDSKLDNFKEVDELPQNITTYECDHLLQAKAQFKTISLWYKD